MVAFSTNLLGMTMHLAGVMAETLGHSEAEARKGIKRYNTRRESPASQTSQDSEDSLRVHGSSLFS